MSQRGFSFDKLKSKVTGRRSSESSIFELGKSKSSERRNSVSNPMIVISESVQEAKAHVNGGMNRFGTRQISLINGTPGPRSRSRSGTRSISKKQTKELIKYETSQVILKKLLSVLLELGLQKPIALETTNNSLNGPKSKSAKVYVANTNDCIYLAPASSASFTYEDVENGGIPQDHAEIDELNLGEGDDGLGRTAPTPAPMPALLKLPPYVPSENPQDIPEILRQRMESFNSPNYLCTKIDADSPIPHTFAVVIELKKETMVKDVKFEFQSLTNILWPSCDPYNKSFVKEKFKIGHMEWQTKLSEAFFYINTSNSNDVKATKISSEQLANITKNYKLINVRDLADGIDNINNQTDANISRRASSHFEHEEKDLEGYNPYNVTGAAGNNHDVYKEGLYVFLLPILLPEHIPPTITSINGSLSHTLNVNINKVSDRLGRKVKVLSSYNLPMVRTPPLIANCIADKPIYVDRIWNDALHYVITFPRKYISLGSEHSINVKLIPLVKDVIIKRIKFNVSERITYVSKSLSKEYEYDADDPYRLGSSNSEKTRERVITVCELKTKNRSGSSNIVEPYKEEYIKCPDNNLLFSCYEHQLEDDDIEKLNLDDPLAKTPTKCDNLMIASPLDINIALPFLTTRNDKTILSSSVDDEDEDDEHEFTQHQFSNPTSRKASITRNELSPPFSPSSPIIGALETNLSHTHDIDIDKVKCENQNDTFFPDVSAFMQQESRNHLKENIQQGYTTVSKALYPDSNFRHIQIFHRLQICFRISKPDPKDDGRMHHYEVVVDTPLVLLSAKCNQESIQLPKYDDINLDNCESNRMYDIPQQHVPFRTPNFENNGVSIKPLNEDEDFLPSFEEATSAPSSPLTRSVSFDTDPLSRTSSIIPTDPAPAYERNMNKNDKLNDLYGTYNIDAVVNDIPDASIADQRRSTIRSSLVNSFAPPIANCDLNTTSSSSHRSESTDNVSTTATSSSNGRSISDDVSASSENSLFIAGIDNNPAPDSSCTESSQNVLPKKTTEIPKTTSEPIGPQTIFVRDDTISAEPKNFAIENTCNPNNPHQSKLNSTGTSSDQVSLFTQDSNFDQRIPLLQNASIDEENPYPTGATSTHDKNYSSATANKYKISTESLSMITEMNGVDDIYRPV